MISRMNDTNAARKMRYDIWVFAISAAIALLILALEVGTRSAADRLVATGERTQAEILRRGVERDTYSTQTGQGRPLEYPVVTYRFETADGPETITGRVTEAFWEAARVGDWHPVWYDPRDPRRSLIDPPYQTRIGTGSALLILIFGAIATVKGFQIWIARRDAKAAGFKRSGRS